MQIYLVARRVDCDRYGLLSTTMYDPSVVENSCLTRILFASHPPPPASRYGLVAISCHGTIRNNLVHFQAFKKQVCLHRCIGLLMRNNFYCVKTLKYQSL